MGETKWDYTSGWETTEVCERCGQTFRQTVNVPGAGMDGCATRVPGRSLCTECAPLPIITNADPGDESPEPAMQTAEWVRPNIYSSLAAELAQARADLARVTGEMHTYDGWLSESEAERDAARAEAAALRACLLVFLKAAETGIQSHAATRDTVPIVLTTADLERAWQTAKDAGGIEQPADVRTRLEGEA